MKLNAKAEYALRAMVDLARRPGEQTTLGEIAARQHVPVTMLPNIVQTLARAELVETVRGHGGGVRLGRPPEEITVAMVLEAVEGPLRLYRCSSGRSGPCPIGLGEDCPLRELWDETGERLLELWGTVSLADLAAKPTQRAVRASTGRGGRRRSRLAAERA